jgi:Domain of unknown function (DUF3846)
MTDFDKHPHDKMINVLVVRADGTSALEYLPQSWLDRIAKREIGLGEDVFYERVRLSPHFVMYLDEDGKRKNLPMNSRATQVFTALTGIRDDFICGNAIVAGPTDSTGYDQTLDVQRLIKMGLFVV